MVLSESLFGLPISQFDELIKMENANTQYTLIYEIFRNHQEKRNEWAVIQWTRLEYDLLDQGAKEFVSQVKKLQRSKPEVVKMPPFVKLQEAIKGFQESLPLIQALSDPAVVERHWKRIIEETGKDDSIEINMKTLTLQKVFELELQNHEENIKEICKEAKEEKKNDEIINKIDDAWKGLMFEVFPHVNKVTGVEKGKAIKSPDEVKELIEQHTLQL